MWYPLTAQIEADIKAKMRTVPDFPKPGIKFKDLSTLLCDHMTMRVIYDALAEKCETLKPDYLALLEARGFLIGPPVAMLLGIGTIMIRKPKKLPGKVVKTVYELEYGTDELSIQSDIIPQGSRVIIIDDLLATGGTAAAACALLREIGTTVVGAGFVSELTSLNGRFKFDESIDVFSLLYYDANME
jgi:adenine phosphoribosyltransferase